jgi:hypothetical protein
MPVTAEQKLILDEAALLELRNTPSRGILTSIDHRLW